MLLIYTFRKKSIVGEESLLVEVRFEVTVLDLHSVRTQKHRRLWWAVHILREDCFLHLKEEQTLRDLLNQFPTNILREKLGSELELHWGL